MFYSTPTSRGSKSARSIFRCAFLALLACAWTLGAAPAGAQPSDVTSQLPDACPGKQVTDVLTYALLQAQTQFANIRGGDLGTQHINLEGNNEPAGIEFDREYEVIGTGYDFCPNFFTLTHDDFASAPGGPVTYAMGWSLRYVLLTEELTETQAADALVGAYTPLLPGYKFFREALPGSTGGTPTDDVRLAWTLYGSPHSIFVTAFVLHCGEQTDVGIAVDCGSRSAANEITVTVNSL